jgi:hypothetical protein
MTGLSDERRWPPLVIALLSFAAVHAHLLYAPPSHSVCIISDTDNTAETDPADENNNILFWDSCRLWLTHPRRATTGPTPQPSRRKPPRMLPCLFIYPTTSR